MEEKPSFKKKWICIGVSSFFGIALIMLGIILPIVIDHIAISEATKKTLLTQDNIGFWGQIPGQSGAVVIRNFTFFDFQNPLDVMFRSAKPIFVEVGPFTYQEHQNFTDPTYNSDGTVVDYKFWIYVTKMHKEQSKKIKFANFVGKGAWFQMNNVEPALMILQSLGQLVFGMEQLILPNMLSVAIQSTLITNYDSTRKTLLAGFSEEKALALWNDKQFGMKNATSLIAWINAANDGDTDGSSDFLRDYFDISLQEIQKINAAIRTDIKSVFKLLSGYYCVDTPDKTCTAKYLTSLQWGSQGLTMNPPPIGDVKPVPSVVVGNSSGFGYPELSYFYTEYFLKTIDSSIDYQNLVFNTQWAMKILDHANYTIEDPQFLTDPWILLNIGNIRYAMEQGRLYNDTKDLQYMQNIQVLIYFITNLVKARVFYEYLVYVGGEFTCQKSKNGTTGIAAMGAIMAQGLYGEFSNLKNQFFSRVVSQLLFKEFQQCDSVLTSIEGISNDQISKFCQLPEYKDWDYNSLSHVQRICDEPYGTYWSSIHTSVGLTNIQLQQLCDWDQEGFGNGLKETHTSLKELYKCSSWATKCSQYEIAIKQWMASEITLNPPNGLWTSTNTVNDVYPDLFKNPMEYYWFSQNFSDVLPPMKSLSYEEANYLLSYDCLFSAVMVIEGLLYEKNNDKESFKKWFLFDDFKQINHYFRYIMVQVVLGGVAIEEQWEKLLFGYEDIFLKTLAQMNPAMGGDPSIGYVISLSPNNTVEKAEPQSMYTGTDDNKKVRRYKSVRNLPYITVAQPLFNGIDTQVINVNPWTEETQFTGTDAFCFHTDVSKDEILKIVVTDLYRAAKLIYSNKKDIFGLETYHFTVDPAFLDINPIYHNDKFVGLINFTSVQRAPVFNSFAHFSQADPKLQEFIEIYKDYDLKDRQFANQYDASYVDVEPISGVGLSALINLQINLEYEPDFLFPSQGNYAMLPILWIYRGGNFTEKQIEDNYGDLKLAGTIKQWIFWLGIILGCLLIIMGIAIYYFKIRKFKAQQKPQPALINQSGNISLLEKN